MSFRDDNNCGHVARPSPEGPKRLKFFYTQIYVDNKCLKAHTHAHQQTCTHICMQMLMYACTCTRAHTHTHVCMHACTCTHTGTHTNTHTHTHARTHARTHAHAHTCTHMHLKAEEMIKRFVKRPWKAEVQLCKCHFYEWLRSKWEPVWPSSKALCW